MSNEKHPKYKSAEEDLSKNLGKPIGAASKAIGWAEFIEKGKGLVGKTHDFFAKKGLESFEKRLPESMNNLFGVLGLVVSVVSFPLSIYDTVKKFLKITDTDTKLMTKGVSKAKDLDGDVSLGFKIIQFILSAFRTGAAGALAFAAAVAFISGKVTISSLFTSTVGSMASFFGFFALGITAVISIVNLVKSAVKSHNVSKLEKSFKERFEKDNLDQKVEFENLVEYLRNENAKEMRWDVLVSKFASQKKNQLPESAFPDIQKIFEKHLPRNRFLGMDRGIKRVDLEALEKALKGGRVSKEYMAYRALYLELEKNKVPLDALIGFIRETRLSMKGDIGNSFVNPGKTVTAEALKDYLDMRDDYWKLKKVLIEKGIDPKKDAELARHNIYLKEKLTDAKENLINEINRTLNEDSFLKKTILKNPKEMINDQTALNEFADLAWFDDGFKSSFKHYIEVSSEQEKINAELTKRLKGKEGVDEKSLDAFLTLAKDYENEKEQMIKKMGGNPETLRDMINMVEGRKDKLAGKLVGKGISLGLAIIGLTIGVFTGFPLLLLIGITAVTLVWTLIDKFAPLPWKKWGTEEKRLEPPGLSDSELTYYLKSHDHKGFVNKQDQANDGLLTKEAKISEFGQQVESTIYNARMRKEVQSVLKECRDEIEKEESPDNNRTVIQTFIIK